MRRYWLESSAIAGPLVNIEGEAYRHIFTVCRQGLGSQFEVLCGDGKALAVEVVEVRKRSAVARIVSSRELEPLPVPRIHLALSLPKLATLEAVVEKSVELGVASFHVFRSDFSNVKGNTKNLGDKEERLQKILLGATQQTGRGDRMELTLERPMNVLLDEVSRNPSAAGVFAYEGEGQQTIDQAMAGLKAGPCEDIWLFVGSEGGFSERDIKLFSDSGMIPTSLGRQVLRVETACVSLVAVIKYGLGHFS